MQNLIEALEKNVIKVTFKKANGDIREMDCTLMEYLLPETSQSSNHSGDETAIVFDLDANAWRSFRLDSVISMEAYDV